MVRATASDRVHAARRAVQAWGRHDIHPMRSGGVKSFADDLVLGRAVVLSRAATSLRSIETQPLTRRFVRYGRAQSPRSTQSENENEKKRRRNGERERDRKNKRRARHSHRDTDTDTHTHTCARTRKGRLAPAERAGPVRSASNDRSATRPTSYVTWRSWECSLCRCAGVSLRRCAGVSLRRGSGPLRQRANLLPPLHTYIHIYATVFVVEHWL